ncbi:MAG: hypothetical protein JRI43_04080 [Deltaproteobacteria bacterium]|nr:hypothetical protein [Deltaproteobacteria bacterium]
MSRVAAQVEKKGIPVVLESFDDKGIRQIAHDNFLREGVPAVREVYTPQDTTLQSLPEEFIPRFIDQLTRSLTDEEKKSGFYEYDRHEGVLMTGTFDEVSAFLQGELIDHPSIGPIAEMTDGLPIIPPTQKRVEAMLKGTSHDPEEILEFPGFLVGSKRLGNVRKAAINAVMAGCTPDMMPAVLAIAEAGAAVGYPGDSSFGHLYCVSGPYGREIGMNSGFCYLAPGNPANMTLQRAAMLMGINLGGARMGINVLERTGSLHWGTIFAEDENTPWEGLNEHFGFSSDESVLLSWGGKVQLVPFQNIEVKSVETLQDNMLGSPDHAVEALKTLTNTNGAILAFTPDAANSWAEVYGFRTMKDIQEYMYKHATWKRSVWGKNYWIQVLGRGRKGGAYPRAGRLEADIVQGPKMDDLQALSDDADIPKFDAPEDITIIVAGGTGDAWTWGGAFGRPIAYSIDKWR